MQPNASLMLNSYPMTRLSSDFYAAYFNQSVNENQGPTSFIASLNISEIQWRPAAFLLDHLADEWEDEKRKHRPPNKRVDHHDHPPQNAAG